MRVLLCCNTEKGYSYLKRFLEVSPADLYAVCSFKEDFERENYFLEIHQICSDQNVLFHEWKDLKEDLIPFIKQHRIDFIIVMGWKYLFPAEVNGLLVGDIIAYHDSILPRFRGYAPLLSAILTDQKQMGFSVFLAGEGVDEGEVLYQKAFDITDDLYIKDAIRIISQAYCETIPRLLDILRSGEIRTAPQDHSQATYSIWRNFDDFEIDWAKSSREIFNHVRALGDPYFGAFTYLEGKRITIERAQPVDDVRFEIRQPGKLWKIQGDRAVVVCGQGMIEIWDCYDENHEPVLFKKLRNRLGAYRPGC